MHVSRERFMLKGNILTTDGWICGWITSENGRVKALEGARVDRKTNDAPYILPGFVDCHVHGGGGADIMEGGEAATIIAREHAKHGTTSMLATTMTAPRDELMAVVAGLGEQSIRDAPGVARVLGVHLEGPYINPGKLGAQPAATAVAVRDEVLKYLSLAPIRLVTIAPQLPAHIETIHDISP